MTKKDKYVTFYSANSALSLASSNSGPFSSIAFLGGSARCFIPSSSRSGIAPIRVLMTTNIIFICPLEKTTSGIYTFRTSVKLSSFIGAILVNRQPKETHQNILTYITT